MVIHKEPLVSVVIAFLNEEQFVEEAISSVLNQQYKNWELILVDDGSTDGSTAIARKYAAGSGGNIIYCEHDGHINKGLSASRNVGIKKSSGSLVAFLDADDVWLPAKLTNQVSIFEKNAGVEMVAEASSYWYSWNNSSEKDVLIQVGAAPDKVYDPPQLLFNLYPFSKGAAPCPSGLMLKKEAIEKAGYFEASFVREFALYEDQAFLHKIYLREKVYISSACNNLYRQRPESIVKTVRKEGKYHIVRKFFLEWMEDYLIRMNISDESIWKLIKKAMFPYRHPFLNFLGNIVRGKRQ